MYLEKSKDERKKGNKVVKGSFVSCVGFGDSILQTAPVEMRY